MSTPQKITFGNTTGATYSVGYVLYDLIETRISGTRLVNTSSLQDQLTQPNQQPLMAAQLVATSLTLDKDKWHLEDNQ